MTLERFGIIKFKGQDATVLGPDLKVGQTAPEFTVQTLDWVPFHGLADTQGKVRIIAAFLSVDTDVCDREIHRFNQEAAALGKDIAILVLSTDLPYIKRDSVALLSADYPSLAAADAAISGLRSAYASQYPLVLKTQAAQDVA